MFSYLLDKADIELPLDLNSFQLDIIHCMTIVHSRVLPSQHCMSYNLNFQNPWNMFPDCTLYTQSFQRHQNKFLDCIVYRNHSQYLEKMFQGCTECIEWLHVLSSFLLDMLCCIRILHWRLLQFQDHMVCNWNVQGCWQMFQGHIANKQNLLDLLNMSLHCIEYTELLLQMNSFQLGKSHYISSGQ